MIRHNQKGVTVLELLISLAILSFITVIIWNLFFQGLNFSTKEMTKNQMQQEANVIISHLTRIHQKSEAYEIKSSSCKITVAYHEANQPEETITFKNIHLCLSAENLDETATDKYNITGDPDSRDTSVTLIIQDKNNSDINIRVDTLLYRIGGE